MTAASRLFQAKAYLHHWLRVVDEHSIHSPYFFDFYDKVICEKGAPPRLFDDIEALRDRLLKNDTLLEVHDLGAQSQHFNSAQRTIARITKTSTVPPAYCRLLFRLIHYINATQIVELGTSMGLTTLYLGLKPDARVVTFEGSQSLISVALTHFEYFNKKNIRLIEGNIDQTLPEYLLKPAKIDFVFIDANHRYEPTVHYFNWLLKRIANKGVIVVDDIHYSGEMAKAWNEIRHHELVYASMDLFRCGILFFDPALHRQHYICSL
jgi:predicted O-methyltransferase YrrM